MNIRKINAVMMNEFLHLARDYRSLAMAFAIPVLLILLFGYALSLDVEHIKTIVIDQDRTDISRDFIRELGASRYFTITASIDSSGEIDDYLDHGRASLAFVIPPGFTKNLRSDRPAPMQVILDGSDPNFANISKGYVNGFINAYNQVILADFLNRSGLEAMDPPVNGCLRVWFNENLLSRNFIIPGIIAIIIIIAGTLLTSLVVAREYENGTMETLKSIPLGAMEFMIGKAVPYYLIAIIDVLVSIFMGQILFNVVMKESFWIMMFASTLYVFVAISIGLLLSTSIKNQLVANQAAILITYLPSFLLSNFVFPITNMPKALQLITYFVPAKYYISILSDIFLRDVGFSAVWTDYAVLAAIPVILTSINYLLLKKEGL
ncbi:MAG TPA: ABC transporter permease [Desulfomonilia bacterium]